METTIFELRDLNSMTVVRMINNRMNHNSLRHFVDSRIPAQSPCQTTARRPMVHDD